MEVAIRADSESFKRHHGSVTDRLEKALWAQRFPKGEPAKDTLGRLVEVDHDEAETELYESASDPTFVQIEREQRRYRAMLRRRLRRRSPKK